MGRAVPWILALAGAILLPAAALAAPSWDASLDLGYLTGDTTYRIGGLVTDSQGNSVRIPWPLSELRWPLDTAMASVSGRADFTRLSLRIRAGASLTDKPGDMVDSDWGVYYLESGDPRYRTDSLDVYSTSEATLEAMTVDCRARYGLFRTGGLSVAGGVGVLFQRFAYEGRGTVQHSPSAVSYGLPEDRFAFRAAPGQRTIVYDVTYSVPYLEISADARLGRRATVEASLAYSPVASADDSDDHVLRGKLSEGACTGSAVMAEVGVRVELRGGFYAAAGLGYLAIHTDGVQVQTFYNDPALAGYRVEIDDEITSSQGSAYLRGGFVF